MDIATIVGIVLALSAIMGSILTGGSVHSFY